MEPSPTDSFAYAPSLRSQRGQALIQVLITLGVMGVLTLSFMTLTENQRQGAVQLQQKLASLDLQRSIGQLLQDGRVCDFQLVDPAAAPFNPAAFQTNPAKRLSTLPGILAHARVGAQFAIVADGTTPASSLDDDLVVTQITVDDVVCSPAPCSAGSDTMDANISVAFDQKRLLMALRPLKFPVTLNLGGSVGARTIAACHGRSILRTMTVMSADQTCAGATELPNCQTIPTKVVAPCPPGYMVTGCGFRLSQWKPFFHGNPAQPDRHTNAPDTVMLDGNGCSVWAGGAPGCGVCFKSQAMCLQIK